MKNKASPRYSKKLLPVLLFAAGLASQSGAFFVMYMAALSYKPGHDLQGFDSIGAAITSWLWGLAVTPILAFAAVAIIKPVYWVRLGIAVAIVSVAPLLLIPNSYELSWPTIVVYVLIGGLVFPAAYVIGGWLVQKLRLPLDIIFTVVMAAGLSLTLVWTTGFIVRTIKNDEINRLSQTEISQRLAMINFDVYQPTAMPEGYSLDRIVPTSDSAVSTFQAPQAITFELSTEDGFEIQVTEFKTVNAFNPPTDCGPYDAGSVLVGPVDSPIPCQEYIKTDDTAVYYDSPVYIVPAEHNYYFTKDATTVLVHSPSQKFSKEQLQNLVEGLKRVEVKDLPQDLIQEN